MKQHWDFSLFVSPVFLTFQTRLCEWCGLERLFSPTGTVESANEEQTTWSGVISEHLAGQYAISVRVVLGAVQD